MSRTPRHLTVTALVAGAVLLLGACSDSDDNAKPSDKLPSGNTSASPIKTSAAPTTTPPTNTPAPRPTKQGAIDTAIAGIRAVDHAYATWDVRPLKDLSALSCSACQDMISVLSEKKRQGYSMSGGRFTITGPARLAAGLIRNKAVLIKVPVSVSELITRDRKGKLYNNDDAVGSEPATDSAVANLDVKWSANRWQITHLGFNV